MLSYDPTLSEVIEAHRLPSKPARGLASRLERIVGGNPVVMAPMLREGRVPRESVDKFVHFVRMAAERGLL